MSTSFLWEKANLVREGTDVTVISYSRTLHKACEAAEALEGVSVEIIDLRSLNPLDWDMVFASVAKTGRAVVAHEAWRFLGIGAEIAATLHEKLFKRLRAPVARVGAKHVPIPFFILAGNLFGYSELSKRLVRLAETIIGNVPGGLAIVAVVVSIFFAGISGSGPADTAALGALLIPAMIRSDYDRSFAAGLMAAGGGIGIIVPPSIALIIYGVVAGNVSIGKLFIAGIIPGILVGLSLAVTAYLISRRRGYKAARARGNLREVAKAFREAFWLRRLLSLAVSTAACSPQPRRPLWRYSMAFL